MQSIRNAVLVSLMIVGFSTAQPIDKEWHHREGLVEPAGVASLMSPSLTGMGGNTSYGVPYDLTYPICEVNRGSEYWEANFGVPGLGTWLLVRSRETGLSTLCSVVGTFGFESDGDRLLNISPRVADALGVDVEDGLFGIVIEEYLWNVESAAATRDKFLEGPQVYFSRTVPFLSLRDLDRYPDFSTLGPDVMDTIPLRPDSEVFPLPRDPPSLDLAPRPVEAAHLRPEGFPNFPWPAPQPSVSPVEFPKGFYSDAHDLGQFDALLEQGLRSVGYFDKSYFYVPSGFAVVTRLEQINADATPRPDAERWPAALSVSHDWSLASYLRLLFTAEVPVGYGRVLVFVVTDDACVVVSEECGGERTQVDEATVRAWQQEGTGRLPPSMANFALSDSHAVWGIVYEFEKPAAGEPYQTFNRAHQGRTHFVQAGIWDYFEGE